MTSSCLNHRLIGIFSPIRATIRAYVARILDQIRKPLQVTKVIKHYRLYSSAKSSQNTRWYGANDSRHKINQIDRAEIRAIIACN